MTQEIAGRPPRPLHAGRDEVEDPAEVRHSTTTVRSSAGFLARSTAFLRGVGPFLAVAAVIWAPFPFGSASMPTLSVLIEAFCVALAASVVGAPAHLRTALVWPVLFVLTVALVAWLQESSPPFVGTGAPPWSRAAELLGDGDHARLALSAGRTLPALGGPLLAALALACGMLAGRSRGTASAVFTALAILGSLYAAAAIAWHLYSPEYVLWWHKTSHREDLTATFTNRNSAAIFIGFTLIAVIGRLASAIAKASRRGSGVSGRQQTLAGRSVLVYTAFAAVCFVAILLTNSRSGLVLSLVAAALALFLRLRGRRRLNRLGMTAIAALFGLPVLVLALFETRLSDSLSDGGRLATYAATLNMIGDRPWLGVGLGSFAVAFPAYRLVDAPMWGVWDKAHNTFLEIAAEAGLPLAVLLASCWIAAAWLVGRTAVKRPDTTTVTAFAIMMLGLMHSMVDFSIQIPGCGAFFYFASGIGIGRCLDRARRQAPEADREGARRGREDRDG